MKTFKDIDFTENPLGGIKGTLEINGFLLSVIAGENAYSLPRRDLAKAHLFSLFEVAILKDGDFVTKQFLPKNYDDVIGWQTPQEINDIIKTITQ